MNIKIKISLKERLEIELEDVKSEMYELSADYEFLEYSDSTRKLLEQRIDFLENRSQELLIALSRFEK